MSIAERLGRPIDGASLAVFRIAVGALLVVELLNDVANGDFAEYADARFHFHYPFFSWLEPWPPPGMAIHWATTIVLSLAVAGGFALRVATPLLFLAWTSIFLMERSEYVNHTYLYCWITFWLAVLPVGRTLSIDAWRRPDTATPVVPAYARVVLVAQMAVVYVFAGVAKLDADWIAGVPLRLWLPHPDTLRVLRPLVAHEAAPLAIAWGGLAFDLGIVPLLLWRRTRTLAFGIAVAFHVANAMIFGLSSFPWFSIAATSLFLDPSWPRRFAVLRARLPPMPAPGGSSFRVSSPTIALLAAAAVIQLALPLRHWIYPGYVNWTEEGHMFAWRMMVRTKSGRIAFAVRDPESGRTERNAPTPLLTTNQARLLAGQPDMILQFAHFLADRARERGIERPQVFAKGRVSLNGRRPAPIADPSVDLAAERWTLRPWSWIAPVPPPRRASATAHER